MIRDRETRDRERRNGNVCIKWTEEIDATSPITVALRDNESITLSLEYRARKPGLIITTTDADGVDHTRKLRSRWITYARLIRLFFDGRTEAGDYDANGNYPIVLDQGEDAAPRKLGRSERVDLDMYAYRMLDETYMQLRHGDHVVGVRRNKRGFPVVESSTRELTRAERQAFCDRVVALSRGAA